jgi:hypothetical protein
MPVQVLIDEGGAINAVVSLPEAAVEIIATLIRQGGTITLEGLHLEKLTGAPLERQQIHQLCEEFCRHYQAEQLIVRGARRTTGKSAGKVPRAIVHRLRKP